MEFTEENKSVPFFTEQFAQTITRLKGKVTILFITHQKPKGLKTDEAIILGNKPGKIHQELTKVETE
jgi:subfamily B ATP-binding cassette protein HlyB/CyaB